MVSRTSRYAFRILGYLLDHPGLWIQGSQIAADTQIPFNYLSKILNQLRKKGFVLSQKGWGGGFLLREEAKNLPIGEVLDLFEGAREEGICLFELGDCTAEHPCPLHHQWTKVQRDLREMLQTTQVKDLRGFWRG